MSNKNVQIIHFVGILFCLYSFEEYGKIQMTVLFQWKTEKLLILLYGVFFFSLFFLLL